MQIGRIKEIAAGLLKVGKNRIWVNPDQFTRVKEAMTKEDIKGLIGEGIIKKKKENFHSRGRARILMEKKKKGRKRGKGKRKGTKKTRSEKKETWIKNVRAQRRTLKELREKNPAIEEFGYSKLYGMIKGNFFRGKNYVVAYVKDLDKKGGKK